MIGQQCDRWIFAFVRDGVILVSFATAGSIQLLYAVAKIKCHVLDHYEWVLMFHPLFVLFLLS